MIPSLKRLLPALALSAGLARAADPGGLRPAAGSYPLEAYVAVGSNFAQNTRLADLGMDEKEFAAFLDGVKAAFHGQPRSLDPQARQLHEAFRQRLQHLAEEESRARQNYFADPAHLEAYMKDAVKTFHLQRSDSGLAYGLVASGTGRAGPDDTVVLSYDVIAADGQTELPQLSVKGKRTKVADLLPGLAEGVQMMVAHGSAMLILPPDLSYGDGPWPDGVVRGTPIIYTVKLEEILTAN